MSGGKEERDGWREEEGGRDGRGTYHHEIGAEIRKAGERFVATIGDVTRVLVLEKREPELIVPC